MTESRASTPPDAQADLRVWPTVEVQTDGHLVIRYPDGYVERLSIPVDQVAEFLPLASA